MDLGRLLAAAAISALIAAPVLAQTSSPSPLQNRPTATAAGTTQPGDDNTEHSSTKHDGPTERGVQLSTTERTDRHKLGFSRRTR